MSLGLWEYFWSSSDWVLTTVAPIGHQRLISPVQIILPTEVQW